jgi:hypothetical protein
MDVRHSSCLVLLFSTLVACTTEPTPGGDTGASTGEGSTGFSATMTTAPVTSTTMPVADTGETTSGTTTSPADGTATDTGGFVGVEDMGGTGGTCDVFQQDCPEGEKCMPWANDGGGSWNSTRCSPVTRNPGQVNDPCTVEKSAVSGLDDCDLGLMCYSVSVDTGMGTCYELCGGDPVAPTCDEGLCAVYNDGNLPLCLTDCDPILQDCPNEDLCLSSPSENGFVCILDALPFSLGDHGAPCQFVNDCDPGLFCGVQEIVGGCTNASGCCAEYCDISLPDPSAECTGVLQGEQCQPWYGVEVPPPGYEDVGFCGIPL